MTKHGGSIFKTIWMVVDGVGLSLIAAATIMEGVHLWGIYLGDCYIENEFSLELWFLGRSFQVLGLMILIGHAATMQTFSYVEPTGMFFLTIGPMVNLLACSLFEPPNDPNFLYNKQWRSSEIVEVTGMLLLDISLIHMEEAYVLLAELMGFATLCAAAFLQFTYEAGTLWPAVAFRLDEVHLGECIGLMLLSVVAIVQYNEKVTAHAHHHAVTARSKATQLHHHNSTSSQPGPPSHEGHHRHHVNGHGTADSRWEHSLGGIRESPTSVKDGEALLLDSPARGARKGGPHLV